MLRADPRFSSVVVIGHSEGSLIGIVSGAGRGASDILRTQMAGKLPPELATQNEAILVALERGRRCRR